MTIRGKVLRALRRHGQRRMALSGTLARVAQAYLDGYNNDDHDMAANGEARLLARLAPTRPATVFDVGANHGEWSMSALECLPGIALHAFEIAPPTVPALQARLAGRAGCIVNDFGLGETEARIPLEFFPGHDTLTTRLRDVGLHQGSPQIIEGRIRTGEAYCAEQGIAAIDILKIDVEGGEPQVLQGFGSLLRGGRIGVIQFEYGIANVASRFLLRDYHDMLGAAGYEIGKLYPHGVEFAPYRPEREDFRGPYFVAIHRSRPDQRAAVAA